jgi:hypothetical protein
MLCYVMYLDQYFHNIKHHCNQGVHAFETVGFRAGCIAISIYYVGKLLQDHTNFKNYINKLIILIGVKIYKVMTYLVHHC